MADRPHLDDLDLSAYLDGELEPGRRPLVDAHLAECPACAERLSRLRALFARLDALPEVPLPRDFSGAVVERLKRPQPAPGLPLLPRLIFAAQAVAALLIAALVWPAGEALPGSAGAAALAGSIVRELALEYGAAAAGWQDALAAVPITAGSALAVARSMLQSIPSWSWATCLAAASVLWLVGNRWLMGGPLRAPSSPFRRSRT